MSGWRSGWCAASSHEKCLGGHTANPAGEHVECACGCHHEQAKGTTGIKQGLHFNLPNDDYHALTEWYSSTQIKLALPERYKEGGSQDALDFGTLVHSVVLEPDRAIEEYAPLDALKVGVRKDGSQAADVGAAMRTDAWKYARAEAETSGKTVIAQEWWDDARRMREAIEAHPAAHELLFEGEGSAEESAFVLDDGVPCKARFDRRIPGVIVDLKTTSAKPGADSLARTIVDYGYDLSAAHYLAVADVLDLDVQGFVWVFVDKSEHHRVSVVRADPWIERGRILREQGLRRLTDPAAAPYDGATGYLEVPVPGWARLTTEPPAGIPADFTWSINEYA